MRLEILVEGTTEEAVLKVLLKKIIKETDKGHTWAIHPHRGIGSIPKNLAREPKKSNSTLLHNLPAKIRAYGKDKDNDLVVIVLVDLDNKDCKKFKKEIEDIFNFYSPVFDFLVRLAIEELEAWFLGDKTAVKKTYPNVRENVLDSYKQDSICGTWETLAEAVYKGGVKELHSRYGKRSSQILGQKRKWARNICHHMDVDNNESPSFRCFRDGIRNMTAKHEQSFSSRSSA